MPTLVGTPRNPASAHQSLEKLDLKKKDIRASGSELFCLASSPWGSFFLFRPELILIIQFLLICKPLNLVVNKISKILTISVFKVKLLSQRAMQHRMASRGKWQAVKKVRGVSTNLVNKFLQFLFSINFLHNVNRNRDIADFVMCNSSTPPPPHHQLCPSTNWIFKFRPVSIKNMNYFGHYVAYMPICIWT